MNDGSVSDQIITDIQSSLANMRLSSTVDETEMTHAQPSCAHLIHQSKLPINNTPVAHTLRTLYKQRQTQTQMQPLPPDSQRQIKKIIHYVEPSWRPYQPSQEDLIKLQVYDRDYIYIKKIKWYRQ